MNTLLTNPQLLKLAMLALVLVAMIAIAICDRAFN